MAAADYYNPGGPAPTGQLPLHPPRPQPMAYGSANNLPYPVSDAPPPYSPYTEQRPQSQPPPHQRYPQSPNQYSSGQPHGGNIQYPAEKPPQQPPSSLSNMYRPSDFARPQQPQPYPPQQQQGGYFSAGAGAPAMAQAYADPSRARPQSGPPGNPPRRSISYSRSRSRSKGRDRERSRSRPRRHHHHHHNDDALQARPRPEKKKSTGVGTFIGAGGGALLGDAIFPGLGTLGGALLGGFGGHKYGKQRRSYSDSRSYGEHRSYADDSGRGRRRNE